MCSALLGWSVMGCHNDEGWMGLTAATHPSCLAKPSIVPRMRGLFDRSQNWNRRITGT